jgi:hypothetical protein
MTRELQIVQYNLESLLKYPSSIEIKGCKEDQDAGSAL